jgi:hypothetical protein
VKFWLGVAVFALLVAAGLVMGGAALLDWQQDRCAAVGAERAGNGTSLCVTPDGRIVTP